jgi:hypothetical protein
MKQPWNPRRIETKQPKGPRVNGTLLRYVLIRGGDNERVALTLDACDLPERFRGMFEVDVNGAGDAIGVRINQIEAKQCN